MPPLPPKVLITGIGLVTPLGQTTLSTWRALLSARSGITSQPHHPQIPVTISATIPRDTLPPAPPLLTPCPDLAAFALHAASQSLQDACMPDPPPLRSGVSIGVGMCHLPDIIVAADALTASKYRRISPFLVPRILPNTPSGLVALRHALRGPILTPATACAAGAHAIGDAFHIIRRGDADVMLAGGAESAVNPVSVAGFSRANALTTSCNHNPGKASRPFDASRDGFVIGEGACVLVLESEHHAVARGVRTAYAELCGFGMSGDAFHITSPSPDGDGAVRAMQGALKGRDPRDVCYVNAHATSTVIGDAVERLAIAKVLPRDVGARAVVSATKGATGHLLGAAGAVEAAFVALAVADGVVPPTLNLEKLDEDERVEKLGWGDLERYVPGAARKKEVSLAISNSFGFGGTNACVAFAEPPAGFWRKRSGVEV